MRTAQAKVSRAWRHNEVAVLIWLAVCAASPYHAVCDDRPAVGAAVAGFDPTQAVLAEISTLNVGRHDWPQWGGSGFRNNTPFGENIPADWSIGNYRYPRTAVRIGQTPDESRNIKWVVPLGNQTWGNPVVANGRIFIGTNNGAKYIDRFAGDMGVLLCFEEETGRFLWQHSSRKLNSGRVNDWPQQGVCSTPVIDGDRLWYVNNRGEVVCLDTNGFHDAQDDGEMSEDQDVGQWVQVFETPAALHNSMSQLREAFQAAGVQLPTRIQRHGGKSNRWTLGTSSRNRATRKNEVTVHWELHLRGSVLVVLPPADDSGSPRRKLFARPDNLYPSLASRKIDDALVQLIARHGIEVTTDRLKVVSEDAEWEFSGVLFDELRTFRIALKEERLTVSKKLQPRERENADVVWRFDMLKELRVFPHNMSNCSMITADGMLFVCTSNGVDAGHLETPVPRAPSFIAMDRVTGKVLWEDNSPNDKILHAQWASPCYGVFDGQPQIIFPGGDGWVYSFAPRGDGTGKSKLLWKFDANPKEAVWELGGRGTRNSIIGFPSIYDGLVYIAVGQDPEHGEGPGHLWCIDPGQRTDGTDVSAEIVVDENGSPIVDRLNPKRGLRRNERAQSNPNSAVQWHFTQQDLNGNGEVDGDERFHRSMSTPVIKDDILYIADTTGYFHCLDAKTGTSYWNYDTFASCWGSAMIVDGHVYLGDEDGEVHIFGHSSDPAVALAGDVVCEMNHSIYMTPVVANNVLYVASRDSLFAIAADTVSPAGPK